MGESEVGERLKKELYERLEPLWREYGWEVKSNPEMAKTFFEWGFMEGVRVGLNEAERAFKRGEERAKL